MTLKNWKELDKKEETIPEGYYVNDFEIVSLPKELYDKLSKIAEERFGYTGRGIVSDLVAELVESHVHKEYREKIRFQVKTCFNNKPPYLVVTSTWKEEQDNDFLGMMSLNSKEALLQIAKNGYDISEDEIEFVN